MDTIPTVAFGQSGATVEVNVTAVRKSGGDSLRINQQCDWLIEHSECRGIVDVLFCGDGWYEMERLSSLPIKMIDPDRLREEIYLLLETQVWNRPARQEDDWTAHDEYINRLAVERLSREEHEGLQRLRGAVNVEALTRCDIHGDPTYSNAMLRDGQLVLIDPIPAGPRMPSVREVDIAKIMQSRIGYEVIRFSWPQHFTADGYVTHPSAGVRYFLAVHLLRLLPYTPVPYRSTFKVLFKEVVL